MTTMSASSPPLRATKRSRMRGLVSLSSAPPIGMIQPRFSPSGGLLGINCSYGVSIVFWLEHTTLDDAAIAQVRPTCGEHVAGRAVAVKRHQVRVRARCNAALAGQPQQVGDVAGEGRQRVLQRNPAAEQ